MADRQRPQKGSSKGSPKGRPSGRSGVRRRPAGQAPASRPGPAPTDSRPPRAERSETQTPPRDRNQEGMPPRESNAPRPATPGERQPPRPPASQGTASRPPARRGATGPRKPVAPTPAPTGHEFLYGRHAVMEMLLAGRRRVYRVHLAEGTSTSGIPGEIASRARLRGILVREVSRQALDAVGPVNHQGVVAEVDPYNYADLDDLLTDNLPEDALFLVLDHLQDVQNMGTLLRTAEAMGVLGVFLPDRRSAEITPAAVNASAGAVEHLRVAVVHNLAQTLDRCKAAGVWVAGLDAGPGAVPLARADLKGRIALVVGAEGEGLARLVREKCDWLLSIPMYGKVASLNAAVAGSVALVAARQAQRGSGVEPAREEGVAI
jgi:23S rRNA (guanosine2251-2'-O)-methyltransferase